MTGENRLDERGADRFDGTQWSGDVLRYELVPERSMGPMSMSGMSLSRVANLRGFVNEQKAISDTEKANLLEEIRQSDLSDRASQLGITVKELERREAAEQERLRAERAEMTRRAMGKPSEPDADKAAIARQLAEGKEAWEIPQIVDEVAKEFPELDRGEVVAFMKAQEEDPELTMEQYQRSCGRG